MLFGEQGLAANLKRGSVIITAAMVDPAPAPVWAQRLEEEVLWLIDGPVLGSAKRAATADVDAAHALKFPLPLAAAAHQLDLSTAAMGLGAEDDSAVVKYHAALAGLELPAPKSTTP